MKNGHPQPGDIPSYDRKVEAEGALKRQYYKLLQDKIEHERKLKDAREEFEKLSQAEMEARAVHEDLRLKVKAAREALKVIDADFRAHRRAENARLQAEALASGSKTYVTGSLCRNGHLSPRYTSSGACVECDRIGWKDGRLKGAKLVETETEA